MTIPDLEAMIQKLADAKREITAQLRMVEGDLCAAMLALDAARCGHTTKTKQ